MQKTRKILQAAQTFKFRENTKRQRTKKKNRNQRKVIKIFEMELIRQCHHNIFINNSYFNILKKKLQWEFNKDGYETLFL